MSGYIKRSGWVVATMLGCLVLALSAEGASFDCAKAQSKVEHLICDNPEISKLDEELSAAYKVALQDGKQADSIKQAQKLWIKERNGCTDTGCVKQAYQARLPLLTIPHVSPDSGVSTQQQVSPRKRGGDWTYRDGVGKNELLCQDLLNRLNDYYHQNKPLDEQCSWDVVASYSKFTEPPWIELDPRKYEVLLVKLMKYDQEGLEATLNLRPGLKEQNPDSIYRNRAKDFIDQGGRLRMWRTRLIQHDGSEQTIVQGWIPWLNRTELLNRNHGKSCIDKQKISWLGGGYAVTADIGGLDSNVDPDTHGILNRHQLVMYGGKPLLINGKDVWGDGEHLLNHVCGFEFTKGEK